MGGRSGRTCGPGQAGRSTRANEEVARNITQRELRNQSGEIMRGLDQGESFVITRNGVPVGQLTPLLRRQFVRADAARTALGGRLPSTPPGSVGTWTGPSPRPPRHVPDTERHPRGLVDTSVVIDLGAIGEEYLPEELAISAVTMAELAAGPHATDDADERPRTSTLSTGCSR